MHSTTKCGPGHLSEDTVGEDPELPGETRLRTQEHFLCLESWVRGGEWQELSQEDKGLQHVRQVLHHLKSL